MKTYTIRDQFNAIVRQVALPDDADPWTLLVLAEGEYIEEGHTYTYDDEERDKPKPPADDFSRLQAMRIQELEMYSMWQIIKTLWDSVNPMPFPHDVPLYADMEFRMNAILKRYEVAIATYPLPVKEPVGATVSRGLSAMQTRISATHDTLATIAVTLGALTMHTSSKERLSAQVAKTLGALGIDAVAGVQISGIVNRGLAPMEMDATATRDVPLEPVID